MKINNNLITFDWQKDIKILMLQDIDIFLNKHHVKETQALNLKNKQRLSIQILLNNYFQQPIKILYRNSKPYFLLGNDTYFLSISHSKNKAAIAFSQTKNVGIDIETLQPRILTLQDKFLSPQEKNFANNNLQTIHLLWGAKEVIYKISNNTNISYFGKNILILPFEKQNNIFFGRFEEEEFELTYQIINDAMLVYGCKK